MKPYAFYCAVILLLLAACNHKNPISDLNVNNLPSSFITLNADSAYRLETSKGAIIKIPKDAFDVPANTKIRFEVKEAYSMNDILLAGLSTKSNGKLLRSGGMIYLNATADGKDVKLKKPINISIPAKEHDDSMQLFKGEIKDDSSINWTNPQQLDSTKPAIIPEEKIITDSSAAKKDSIEKADCFVNDTTYFPVPDTTIKMLPLDTATVENNNAVNNSQAIPGFCFDRKSVYDFNISELGWCNVDCMYNQGTTEVQLTANIQAQPDMKLDVYLYIPKRKIMVKAPQTSGTKYNFPEFEQPDAATNDIMPLILKDSAFIFVISSDKDSTYYAGLSSFSVSASQNIVVDLKKSSKENILKMIKDNNFDGKKIDMDYPQTITVASTKQEMDMQVSQIPCEQVTDTTVRKLVVKEASCLGDNCDVMIINKPATK